ncbi:MAG: hypothetical protein EBU26_14230 [Verrucomicrobia bacterium]|nr:hypothetical protein [Verrucomicrobiota bacterium]
MLIWARSLNDGMGYADHDPGRVIKRRHWAEDLHTIDGFGFVFLSQVMTASRWQSFLMAGIGLLGAWLQGIE